MPKNIRNVTPNFKERILDALKPRMPAIPVPSQKVVTAIVGAALITATFCTTRVLARKKVQAAADRKLADDARVARERLQGGGKGNL